MLGSKMKKEKNTDKKQWNPKNDRFEWTANGVFVDFDFNSCVMFIECSPCAEKGVVVVVVVLVVMMMRVQHRPPTDYARSRSKWSDDLWMCSAGSTAIVMIDVEVLLVWCGQQHVRGRRGRSRCQWTSNMRLTAHTHRQTEYEAKWRFKSSSAVTCCPQDHLIDWTANVWLIHPPIELSSITLF